MSEISQARINDAAMVAHEANRAFCLSIGDSSQPDWKSAENWQRESAMAGAVAIAKDPSTTPEQSHEQWSAHKIADGWVYGPVKDPVAKTHPCLVPYAELPEEQQRKDALFGGVVRAVLGLPQIPAGHLAALDVMDGLEHRSIVDSLEGELDAMRAELEKLRSQVEPLHEIPKPESAPTASEGPEA